MNDTAETSHLTLDEYAERAAAGQAPPAPAIEEGSVRHPHWIVKIFGGTEQRGRWRLGPRLNIVAVFGGVEIDVGQAEPEAAESLVSIFTLFGGVEIKAPPGVPVVLTGFTLMGGKSDERPPGPRLPGCPVVRIRSICVLGGVSVSERKGGTAHRYR